MRIQAVILFVASWCLAALVLINSYSSTLIIYVIAHESLTLIRKIYDIVNHPQVNVIVMKGHQLENFFMVKMLTWVMLCTITIKSLSDKAPTKKGIYKVIGERMKAYPKSRFVDQHESRGLIQNNRYNVFFTPLQASALMLIYI